MSTELVDFAIVLGQAANAGYCDERCTHGGVCSLQDGHDGEHEALGFGDRVLCHWGDA